MPDNTGRGGRYKRKIGDEEVTAHVSDVTPTPVSEVVVDKVTMADFDWKTVRRRGRLWRVGKRKKMK